MKQLLFILCFIFFAVGCVVITPDEEEETKYLMTAKVDKIHAITSCEGNGTTGKADIYTKITLHKNDTPNGSSWGIQADSGEIVKELSKGEIAYDPGIFASDTLNLFHHMRVEANISVREVDPGGTQVRTLSGTFMRYDENIMCWVEESNIGIISETCLSESQSGTSEFSKTFDTRIKDNTCDAIVTWTVTIEKV